MSNPFLRQYQGSEPENLAQNLDEAPQQLHPVVVSAPLGIEPSGEVIPADRAKPMTAIDFLARVVAPGNWVAIVYKFPDRGMSARFFPRVDLVSAVGYANYVAKRNADVWFGLASYREAHPHPTKPGQFKGKRTQENAQALWSFWLDADISRPGDGKPPGKAFADEAEALQWLQTFCDATGLPYPNLIVRSGYGLHIYWVFVDALSREEWEPRAEAFKHALITHGAKGDLGVTADAARILRLPGTENFKVPSDPKPVGVMHEGPDNIPNELITEKLKPYMGATAPRASKKYSNSSNVIPFKIPGTPPALFANHKSLLNAAAQAGVSPQFEPRTYTFARIAEECPQVKQSLAVGGKDDGEPLWYLGHIRLASFCEDGKQFAHEIGKLHPKYTPADTDDRLKRATNDGLGAPLCTKFDEGRPGVCQLCPHFGKIKSPIVLGGEEAKNNWFLKLKRSDKGKILPVLANAIIAFREAPELQGKLWFDEFQLKTVIRGVLPWDHLRDKACTDAHDVCAAEWLQNKGIMVRPDVAGQAAEKVARERPFNPLREYLDGLVWDGKPRLDTWPINYLGAKDTPYHRAVGAKALIAAVARPYDPGCQCRNVPILEGPQDLGKSKAARKLSEPFFTDDVASLGTKDAAMQIGGAWIAELAELSALNRAEVNAAKAFASRQTDRFRPPYGRRVDTFPRQGVLWGTSNNDQYLRDETGGTRWWPIRCTFIDIPGLTAARDQLWAEAVHRYRAGEKWWIDDPKLLKAAKAEQDARYQADAWQELVEAYCAGKQSVTVGDILGGAIHKLMTDWTRGDEMRISNILVRLGWGRAFITRTPGAKQQWCYVEPGHGSHPNRQRRRKANRR